MLDILIREMSARWGLADQGRPLVQMLVAYMTSPDTGGLAGFLEKFRKAGWGGMVNTWVGNQTSPELPTTSQVEKVLGGAGGLVEQVVARLGLSHDKVTAVMAGMLPQLVSRMTPDGSLPAQLPAEFAEFAREGRGLLGAAAATVAGAGAAGYGATRTAARAPDVMASNDSSSSGGLGKWLPWLLAALVAILGISYCGKRETAPPVQPSTSNEAPAASSGVTPAPVPMPEPVAPVAPSAPPAAPDTSTQPPAGDAPGSAATPAQGDSFTAPEGAEVLEGMQDGMPLLRVFFDTGKTEVPASLRDKSQALRDFVQANPGAQAIISGFNDPTGDPAKNAELSKHRAEAVKAALEAAGLPADRAVLEKPAETTDTGATNAASRRVDVVLRR